MKTKTITTVLSLGLFFGLAAPGCSSSGDENGDGDSGDGDAGDGDGDGDTGGDGDGDTGDGDGDTGDGDGDAGDGDGDTGDGDAMGGMGGMSGDGDAPDYPDTNFSYDPTKDAEPETCADVQIEAEEIFLDMFVILDRSGSMTRPFGDNDSDGYCDIGDANVGSRWCNAINALYGFYADPTTVGTGFSYAEFSNTGCGAFDMDVDFGILEAGDANGQLQALEDALNDNNPNGSTNTEGAIDTLIAETTAHVPMGTRKTIAVLITDGDPNGCEEDRDALNGLMVDHYTDNDIPTFIIGMDGVSANNLEDLAVNAGASPHTNYCISGDDECSYYSVGDGNPTVFMDALADIRSSVLGCEYAVPQADVGLSNFETLEVNFTPDTGAMAVTLDQVADEAACSSDDEYWVDFSGGADPIIKLCPATCDTRGDGASIDISLKCEGS